MQIDWFTVGAQVVNFLVLVVLLKHFLYQPVISAMERREQGLLQTRREAEALAATAEEKVQVYENKLQSIETQKKELLIQAQQDAETEKDKHLQKIQREVAEVEQSWRKAVEQEKDQFLAEARQAIGKEAMQAVRHILTDLANAELEQQLINLFIQKLQNLPEDEIQKLRSALAEIPGQQVSLVSSNELSSMDQQKIVDALTALLQQEISISVEVSPELLCGVVLQVPGAEIEWNISAALEKITENLAKNLRTVKDSGTV